jgi:hypothetical protein
MQNNVTVINKQAFPLLYIVTLLLPKFDHFIQIPVADFKCPQQHTALVGFFLQMLCKSFSAGRPAAGGGGEGGYTAEQLDVAAGDVAAGGSSGRSRQLGTLYCCSDYFTMFLTYFCSVSSIYTFLYVGHIPGLSGRTCTLYIF